jgi:hypothetical protein
MASIKISELRSVGYELFQDSESFLNELNEEEMLTTVGGDDDDGGGGGNIIVISQFTISIGISLVSVSQVTGASFGGGGNFSGGDDD